ncbi:RNA 2',3'-cyclic phosphodiesterase [candidate division WOR-3 bacterium]|nr:RNA 2',3'-cyclic phosphodiesterase [candidate division WOR-3 bacterium]
MRLALWRYSMENFQDRSSKIVAPDNIHVTLKFLGEVRENGFSKLREKAEKATFSAPPFETKLGPYKLIGNRIGCTEAVSGESYFLRVWEKLEEELDNIGYEKEKRRYYPHVTLVRFKGKPVKPESSIPSTSSFFIESFKLYKSELTPKGAIYSEIECFPLKGDKNG